jgi:uncharacterized membrane protein
MGLVVLIIGLAVFLGSHLFTTRRDARDRAIAQLGAGGYRALFSLVSIVGLGLIVWGYGEYRVHEWMAIWTPPTFMRHITITLMLLASIAITAVFIPSRIKMKLRHPMLVAVKIWALAHLLTRGDLGSILLFGSFLAWGVFARIAAKRRGDNGPGVAPESWRNDVTVVVFGAAVFVVLGLYFHPYVIGVPVFGK